MKNRHMPPAPRFDQPRNFRAAACILLFALFLPWVDAARANENRFEPEIRKFEQQDKERPPVKNAVLFTGSSSIRLWTTLAEDFAGIEVLNRGFGGSEFGDLLHFFDRIITPYQPRAIVVYAGSHDLHRSHGGPQEVLDRLKAFRDRVRAELPETKILYISMKPSIKKWKTIDLDREANRLIQAYAEETPGIEFIDIWNPMVAESAPPPARYFKPDLNHPSREGYQLWAAIIRPHLETPAPAQ